VLTDPPCKNLVCYKLLKKNPRTWTDPLVRP
jgi:hypothetical protein